MISMDKKGLLIVISGPAGSGKGTVLKHVLKNEDFKYSVSATTRAPRPGEINGVNYHFITKEDFIDRINSGMMLEHTEYCGNYYGTPLKEAEEVLASGKHLILELEMEGAMNVKRMYPDAVLILLIPPNYATQEARLRGRATETEEKILARLAKARQEILLANEYDYVIYNKDFGDKEAAADMLAIVRAEVSSTKRNPNIIENYLADGKTE